jgi:hypothetical protein
VIAAASTARTGVTDQAMLLLSPPPQPTPRAAQESPVTWDAHRQDDPHIEQAVDGTIGTAPNNNTPHVRRHRRYRREVTETILLGRGPGGQGRCRP